MTEHYLPRGIGGGYRPCYVCKAGDGKLQNCMAAFVDDKQAGERVVAMYKALGLPVYLDFRPREPDWVQVKVGACMKHLPNLEKLEKLVRENDNKISSEVIAQSLIQ